MLLLLEAALAAGGGHGEAAGHASDAAGHGAGHGASDPILLVILVMVGAAYLLARLFVNWAQRRFLFVSGFEYILLGVALGPAIGTIEVFGDMARLAPIIAFVAGWIGLLYGMEFDLKRLMDSDQSRAIRLALAEVVGTGGTVMVGGYAFLTSGLLMEAVPSNDAWLAAGVMACAAAAGSSSAVDLLSETYKNLPQRLLPLLRNTARIGDLFAIGGLGVLFCVFHTPAQEGSAEVVWSTWLVITAALGLLLGWLFKVFLDEHSEEHTIFLALVGIIVLSSGTSFFLQISALTVNLLLGMVLVNTSDGRAVAKALDSSLKPVTLVLMVFAGLLWRPVDPLLGVVGTVGYIGLRTLAKAVSVFVASLGTPMRRDLVRGLMAQGEGAVAIAISFRLVYHGPAADLAFTAILVSVMISELTAPRLLKGLLIDAGELDSDASAWEPST